MTDEDLARFLEIADDPRWPKVIANLMPETRASYERMAQVEIALKLWEQGLGPRPEGVIVCRDPNYRVSKRRKS
jgi:hypothetical protein